MTTISKKAENELRAAATNLYKGGQYYYILKMIVTFKEGAFEYEMDARYMDEEIRKFNETMNDCTSNMKSVRVSNVYMDYSL